MAWDRPRRILSRYELRFTILYSGVLHVVRQ